MTSMSIADILALLKEAWVPEEYKEKVRSMILDSIDMAEDMAKHMKTAMDEHHNDPKVLGK